MDDVGKKTKKREQEIDIQSVEFVPGGTPGTFHVQLIDLKHAPTNLKDLLNKPTKHSPNPRREPLAIQFVDPPHSSNLELLAAVSCGANTNEVALTRYVPVMLIVQDQGDKDKFKDLLSGLDELMEIVGLTPAGNFTPSFGSLDYRPIYQPQKKLTLEGLDEFLRKAALTATAAAQSQGLKVETKIDGPKPSKLEEQKLKAEIDNLKADTRVKNLKFTKEVAKIAGGILLVLGTVAFHKLPDDPKQKEKPPIIVVNLPATTAFNIWSTTPKHPKEALDKILGDDKKDEDDDE